MISPQERKNTDFRVSHLVSGQVEPEKRVERSEDSQVPHEQGLRTILVLRYVQRNFQRKMLIFSVELN